MDDAGFDVHLGEQGGEEQGGVEVVGGAVVEHGARGALVAEVGVVGEMDFEVAQQGQRRLAGFGGQAVEQRGLAGFGLVFGTRIA
ncbi:hypothetical protein SCOR_35895 [Sulfidibacter corallicola]